ncbi:adenylate/guanylate cyclase domain-containing protein [Mycobacterium noviomagense]|uniref:adenylate/guanylate cyclase domain-containing protein n=1 Tax=Mycobacterium noviomagense TaxID=459858 RepID=UPI0009F68A70
MAGKAKSAPAMRPGGPLRRSKRIAGLLWSPTVPVRDQHYSQRVVRRLRVLNFATLLAAVLTAGFGIGFGLVTGQGLERVAISYLLPAVIFALVPVLHRFGEFAAPVTFFGCVYLTIFIVCWTVGTGSGLQFYFLVTAPLVVLLLGDEHIVLASVVAAVGAALAVILLIIVPYDTGIRPHWAVTVNFAFASVAACAMVVATVWYALREITRAEEVIELEYQRSESLLANILPASIAKQLKNPEARIIADKYDDASILFADIAGFTQWASATNPAELVDFLNQLYTSLDRLVERHGLEKVKTSGDSYMVVSGVPTPRPDHLQALANLALDIADAVADLRDPQGRPVPLRIGLAAGPVVAGVVGARRFFYDVWGDAVNVASRMESTDNEGRIQVPQDVYERLKDDFLFEERGDVEVKGKGVMHTWYLVGRRSAEVGSVAAASRHAD